MPPAARISDMPWTWIVSSAVGAAIVLILAYHIVLEGAFATTVGKAILGLHIRNDGDHTPFGGAALRNALRIIDAAGLYAIAFLVSVFSKQKQRLGDHLSQSVVVSETIHPAARAGLIFLWTAVVAGFVAYAMYACPDCGTQFAGRLVGE